MIIKRHKEQIALLEKIFAIDETTKRIQALALLQAFEFTNTLRTAIASYNPALANRIIDEITLLKTLFKSAISDNERQRYQELINLLGQLI